MLIGFDGSRSFVEEKTGTENYSYQILKNLAKIDTQNKYLIYIRPGAKIDLEEWPENYKFKVINYQRFWTQIGLGLKTFTDNLDILFVPSHTLPLFRKPNLKTVMTVHDLGAEYLPKMHQIKQRLYLSFITKMQLKNATKLIAVSKSTKNDLIKKVGIKPSKIKVIYEAVDKNQFFPPKNDVLLNTLKQFDLKRQKYFFFVGTIQPRKNLIRLIRSFAKLNDGGLLSFDTKLVLAGGKGWLSNDIYEEPENLGIGSKVKFIGRIDKDLTSLLSGAIALTFPSLFEGFGLPILEAFACNCPVITSKNSSMPEVAGEGALLVDPFNILDISKAMEKIVDKNVRQKLIKKGQKQLEKFSWEKAARETLKFLEA